MASAPHDDEAITTYSMHVSAKYLELTKKKLELTRLPRELALPDERRWEMGTPKSVLEPLLDFWYVLILMTGLLGMCVEDGVRGDFGLGVVCSCWVLVF
ncbi:hypothetical protein EJ02DRAFT_460317 [Clathrospora elynae]|uniref:Epoxide hydrolase N-terminal domain-containing protein n=1 Tax=Clathrospora elynae TaxID=706981 RepID=A0A6A5S5Y1_9PLEO|nr:hypothetical protein EJ02DRAFT_460317 [Clathrospora elynae]